MLDYYTAMVSVRMRFLQGSLQAAKYIHVGLHTYYVFNGEEVPFAPDKLGIATTEFGKRKPDIHSSVHRCAPPASGHSSDQ